MTSILRADERDHFLRVTAGQAFQFVLGQLARVAGNAALGAAVGQTGQGAFPAHPHRQRRHLAQRHVRMIAQAALGRAERQMVLHAVAGEHLGGPVVAMNRQGDRHGALGIFDAVALGVGDLQMVGHQVKLLAGHPESRVIVDFHAPEHNNTWVRRPLREPAPGHGGPGFGAIRTCRERVMREA